MMSYRCDVITPTLDYLQAMRIRSATNSATNCMKPYANFDEHRSTLACRCELSCHLDNVMTTGNCRRRQILRAPHPSIYSQRIRRISSQYSELVRDSWCVPISIIGYIDYFRATPMVVSPDSVLFVISITGFILLQSNSEKVGL